MPRQFHFAITALVFLLFSRCAQMGELTGGERDRTPPVLVSVTPPPASTSFTAGHIVFQFDEYVQVSDLSNQLVVSPRLPVPPEVVADGKTVRVSIDTAQLQPGTTYQISFGQAIADMNESNKLTGLNYVFSTGSVIDTLELTGSVSLAASGAPAPGVVVGLYMSGDSLTADERDSLPMLVPPDYVTYTNLAGRFRFQYLPEKTFALFALKDQNRNKRYEVSADQVAFLNDSVRAGTDTTGLVLRLFEEPPPHLFVKRSFSGSPGVATVIYNKKSLFRLTPLDSNQRLNIHELKPAQLKDTLIILYHDVGDTLALRVESAPGDQADTVRIAVPVLRAGRKRQVTPTLAETRLPPGRPALVAFPFWMDTSRWVPERLHIRSADDSLIGERQWTTRWHDVRTLALDGEWHRGSTYHVTIDTGFVRTLDGAPNDSAKTQFRVTGPEDVSKLVVNLLVDRKQAYVAQLLGEKDRLAGQHTFSIALASPNRVQLVFEEIPPGNYRLKVIYDDNENGQWDTGDLLKRTQPERVVVAGKQFKLLADWEVEEEVEVRLD